MKGVSDDEALFTIRGIRCSCQFVPKDKSKDRSIVSSCSNANPMDGLDLVCYAIVSLRGLLELSTEDDADPKIGFSLISCAG